MLVDCGALFALLESINGDNVRSESVNISFFHSTGLYMATDEGLPDLIIAES